MKKIEAFDPTKAVILAVIIILLLVFTDFGDWLLNGGIVRVLKEMLSPL